MPADEQPVYRYGDFPELFWDLRRDAPVEGANPAIVARLLELAPPETLWKLVPVDVLLRDFERLDLPEHTRRFWSIVVEMMREERGIVAPHVSRRERGITYSQRPRFHPGSDRPSPIAVRGTYRYGDLPQLFWDLPHEALVDGRDPLIIARVLENAPPELVWKLVPEEVLLREFESLDLPDHTRRFWSLVVEGIRENHKLPPGARPLLKADLSVVTPFHVALMAIVAEADREQNAANLRLDGGTGLAAYYLHHRQSEDLDFFADPGLSPQEFGEAVRGVAARAGVEMKKWGPQSTGMATYEATDPEHPGITVKLQFAVQSPFKLAPLETAEEGIRVGSYRDICAGKLHAACDRLAYRDFYDVHVILTRGERDVSEDVIVGRFRPLLADLLESDPGLNPSVVGQGLARVVGHAIVELIPLRLLIPATSEEIHRTLGVCIAECARQTRKPGQ